MRSSAVVGIVGLIVMCVLAVNAYSQPRVALRDFMRAKLKFSQQALEGLVMDDLPSVHGDFLLPLDFIKKRLFHMFERV